MPGPLFLQAHVFLSRGKRHWVILDIDRDKYLCVDRCQFEALGPSLHGWEATTGERDGVTLNQAAVPEDAVALANDLLSLNILSERADHAKGALPTAYPLPTEAFDLDSPARSRRSLLTHAGSFFASAARASRELRGQRLQATVEWVRARKNHTAGRYGPFDHQRAVALVSVFDRMRWFYPRAYLCLFDSLALIHFLARFHVYPDWVFGVAAEPFEAHCWVQAGSVVLNDTVERVSAFTPIMYI